MCISGSDGTYKGEGMEMKKKKKKAVASLNCWEDDDCLVTHIHTHTSMHHVITHTQIDMDTCTTPP